METRRRLFYLTLMLSLYTMVFISSSFAETISGTVYGNNGKTPVPGIEIYVYNIWDRVDILESGTTDENGNYTISIDDVSSSEIILKAYAGHVTENYISTYYMESGGYAANWSEADLVTVTEGQETTGIDFSLGLGGWISGTVYESNGTTPAAGVYVSLYMADCGDFLAGGSTDENGKYVIGHLPGDRVTVYVDTYHLSENYFSGYYMASGYSDDCSGAIPVSVTVGEYTDKSESPPAYGRPQEAPSKGAKRQTNERRTSNVEYCMLSF